MYVSLVGVNYSTTPISFREKLAISKDRLYHNLLLLRQYVAHGIILATCNRTEVYAMDRAEEASINFLSAMSGVSFADLLPHIYLSKNETAFRHLFDVASGLDSMIVGEFEVLGQVRHALEVAERAGMVNLPLRHIFQSAIRAGRRVRKETGIGKNPLSISSVAVDLAAKVVGNLERSKVLVIGAGQAGKLVAKAVRKRGASQITIASRSEERASILAAMLGGSSISLDNLKPELTTSDIVISCTGAPHSILKVSTIDEVMSTRPNRPLVIIDIAVPRDVEPEVKQVSNVFLYDIDDLTQVSELNRQQREGEIEKAGEIIADEVSKFVSWWRAFEVRPVVSALMKKAEEIRCAQLNKTLRKLPSLSDEERANIEAMTKSIVQKLLHQPLQNLKKNKEGYIQVVSELFGLNEK